jgi:protein-disulfide isomerase
MPDRIDRILSRVLVAATVVIAAVLVHREFSENDPPEQLQRKGRFVSSWAEIIPVGRIVGDSNARIKIIEFTDFECPYCRAFHKTLSAVRSRYPRDVAVVHVHFPLPSHRFASLAARVSECGLQVERFGAIVDVLFEKQDSFGLIPWTSYAENAGIPDTAAFSLCVADTSAVPAIERGIALARRLEISGTPTVLVNGWLFGSPPTESELIRAIDDIRAGTPPYPGYPASSLK